MNNFIIPNFYENYKYNTILINEFSTDKNLIGVQGTFLYSIMAGGINNIENYSLCVYEDIVQSLEAYDSFSDIVLLDFGNIQLTSTDIYDSFCNMIFEECANKEKVYFEVADIILIKYLIDKFPKIKLVLHENYTMFHTSEQIQDLINLYPNNIKKIIITEYNECKKVKNINKIYLLPLNKCYLCRRLKRCIQYENNKTLEYSEKSYINECKQYKNYSVQEILNKIKNAEKNTNTFLFSTIPHTKVETELQLLESVLSEV